MPETTCISFILHYVFKVIYREQSAQGHFSELYANTVAYYIREGVPKDLDFCGGFGINPQQIPRVDCLFITEFSLQQRILMFLKCKMDLGI